MLLFKRSNVRRLYLSYLLLSLTQIRKVSSFSVLLKFRGESIYDSRRTNRRWKRFKKICLLCSHPKTEEDADYVGAGTLGDIMSVDDLNFTRASSSMTTLSVQDVEHISESSVEIHSPTKSGLVTHAGGTLQSQFGVKIPNLSPLDRIALTSNGNLQRIFSSFYDAPVHVHVDSCVQRKVAQSQQGETKNLNVVWDRKVRLIVFDQVFCTATSVITVHSADCIEMVNSGKVGLGQLFRYLDKLPTFEIIDAGTTESGGLWRKYKLGCTELCCEILEEFAPNAWHLKCPNDGFMCSRDSE